MTRPLYEDEPFDADPDRDDPLECDVDDSSDLNADVRICTACGREFVDLLDRCPGCGEWVTRSPGVSVRAMLVAAALIGLTLLIIFQ